MSNDGYCLLSTYYVPGTLLSALHLLSHPNLLGRYCYYLHFTDEETEPQEPEVTCSK